MTTRHAFAALAAAAFLAAAAPLAAQTAKTPETREEKGGWLDGGLGPLIGLGQDGPADATSPLDDAFARLASPDPIVSARAAKEIAEIWSDPGSDAISLLVTRGERAAKKKDWATAERHFTHVVNLAPDFAAGWVLRAGARMQGGELGLALADAAEALRLEPRHYEALLLAGLIYHRLDYREQALEAMRAVLEINPHVEQAKQVIRTIEPLIRGVEA